MPVTIYQEKQTGEVEIVPRLIPAAGEDVFTADIEVTELHLVNSSGSAVTVTVTDKQGTPLPLVAGVSIAANADHLRQFRGRLCPGGLHWSASVDAVVTGAVRGRQ